MSNVSRYPKNGVCRFENFAQLVESNNFPEIPIGSVGGIDGWFVSLKKEKMRGETFLYPYAKSRQRNCWQRISLKFIFMYINGCEKNYQLILQPDWIPSGRSWKVETLLNKNSRFLRNGALTIEYGFYIEAVEGTNDVWNFNFYDRLYGRPNELEMITFTKKGVCENLYSHKQILSFHSPCFKDETYEFEDDYKTMERFLQIAHGVKLDIIIAHFPGVLNIAERFQMRNVFHFCERQLIEDNDERIWVGTSHQFRMALALNLTHYLTHLLKHLKPEEQLKDIMEDVEIDEMSGDCMKICVKYFFDK